MFGENLDCYDAPVIYFFTLFIYIFIYLFVNITGALLAVVLTGASWFVLTHLVLFVFAPTGGSVFGMVTCTIFIVIPTVNNIRIYVAVRRHNKVFSEEGFAERQQLVRALQTEKKMALDMALISLLLLLSLAPSLLNNIVSIFSMEIFLILQPWTITAVFLNSSLNPIVYIRRNKTLRDAAKSVLLLK